MCYKKFIQGKFFLDIVGMAGTFISLLDDKMNKNVSKQSSKTLWKISE